MYFAERMAERLAGIDGVEVDVVHAAKSHLKIIKSVENPITVSCTMGEKLHE